jgi:PAS domain S-box-containing protein
MKNNKVRFSLKLKLILYMSLMVVAISGAFTWLYLTQMKQELKEELEKRGLSEAINLGFDSKYGVLTEDSEILNQLIEGRINKPDIIYVIILDNDGKVLASSHKDQVGKILDDEMAKKALTDKTPSFQLYSDVMLPVSGVTSKAFYDISAPVLSSKIKQTEFPDEDLDFLVEGLEDAYLVDEDDGDSISEPERLGVVRVGLSLDSMHKKMNEMVFLAIMVTTLIIIIAIGISFVVAKITVSPLIHMSKVASQIAEGDLSKTVTTKSTDEIGVMTNNFNRMAAKLRYSIGGLESKVKERTIELEKAGIKTDAIIQNMTDGLVALDPDLKIFLTNKKFEEITGKSDVVGKNIVFISEVFGRIAKDTLKDTNTSFTEVTISENLILKIGSSLIIHDDIVLGVLLILRDITVEKEVDKMKTEFISTVSHELRTPLTSVLGFASNTYNFYRKNIVPALPKDNEKLNKRSKIIDENLSIIVSEGERLTRLIDDILDIAKMEAGKIEWNIQEINTIDICRQALSAISGYPKSSQVKIRFEAPENVRSAKGDPDRLVQVITNLISNALKFTEQGSVTLKVEPENNRVKVSVSDTGSGIEEKQLGKVFDKFEQIGNTLTDKPIGTGLGLPICKEIIKHLGGTIWAESEVGKGSCFYFTLNYYSAERKKRTRPVFRIKKRIVEEVTQKISADDMDRKPNVLIVDDDLNIRKFLRQELESVGYNILEADNGTQALITVKNKDNHVDLILLDIMMPNVDGFDVLSAVKTNEKLAHIPIVVISAYEVEKKVYRLGADCFLHKPIDRIQLINKMSFLLKNEGSKKKVLIIDSNDDIIVNIKSYLEEKGYAVNCASNSKDGLEKAHNEKPDVIMLDLAMPDIKNGLETLKKLRLLEETTGHIHVILLADRMNEYAQRIAESLKIETNESKKAPKSSKDF